MRKFLLAMGLIVCATLSYIYFIPSNGLIQVRNGLLESEMKIHLALVDAERFLETCDVPSSCLCGRSYFNLDMDMKFDKAFTNATQILQSVDHTELETRTYAHAFPDEAKTFADLRAKRDTWIVARIECYSDVLKKNPSDAIGIDGPSRYAAAIQEFCRSKMNVCNMIPDVEQDKKLAQARMIDYQIRQLKAHRWEYPQSEDVVTNVRTLVTLSGMSLYDFGITREELEALINRDPRVKHAETALSPLSASDELTLRPF